MKALVMGSNTNNARAVDAYATRILKQTSPPEACLDDSLGPYVTSMLRISSGTEMEQLVELVQEHCHLTLHSAELALYNIATAVQTGIVPPMIDESYEESWRMPLPTTMSHGDDEHTHNSSSVLEELIGTNNSQYRDIDIEGRTPLKPDRLIPVDLMGVLDDPPTPVQNEKEDSFPPLGVEPKKNIIPKQPSVTTITTASKQRIKEDASDLKAALFRPARPRQNSIHEEQPRHTPPPQQPSPPMITDNIESQQQYYYQYQQWQAAVELLLVTNSELSDVAAAEAVTLGGPLLAQQIIDKALAAPPVCRHILQDGCYRSDCTFSHDMDGHTCLFWLRKKCAKGDACRFRHGFSDKLLEGLEPVTDTTQGRTSTSTQPIPIATKNLVSHNLTTAYSAPQQYKSPFYAKSERNFGFGADAWGANNNSMLSSSWGEPPVKRHDGFSSFASIASKGYTGGGSYAAASSKQHGTAPSTTNVGPLATTPKAKFVKIPQDLWNPHVNRNANAFHITNPLERYKEVSKTVSRDNVIDLHFQSTKTFGVVLETILPQKLREFGEVWIVTGSGHSVSKQTHQISGGALEMAAVTWLEVNDYSYVRGRDRNGHGGALLVKQRQQSK